MVRRLEFTIVSWERIVNQDPQTKNDYPNGFNLSIRISPADKVDKQNIYIHRNKTRLLFPGATTQAIYAKQGNTVSTTPGQQELFRFISELADNFPANGGRAIERFKTHNFIPSNYNDGSYVRNYDKVKAVVYGEYPDLYNDNIIRFILEFDSEAVYATTLQNLTTYLSEKYDENKGQSYDETYIYTYFGSRVIIIMDGKRIYSGFTLLISIG